MRSKRQRIFIFVLSSIVLGLALSAVVLITASNLIHSKQLKQIQLVEQFTYSNLGDNAKLLSKQLRAAVELDFLTITDHNSNVLYRYIQPEHNYHLITPILQSLSMYTEPTSIITSNGELYIEFHSSYDEFLRLFTGLLFFMFLAPTIILGLNSIIRVKHPFKQNAQLDDELENQQIKDKLTGLPTSPIFIQEFEFLVDKNKSNKGHFILIRATQLQHLNFNLGYPAGDKYIQLIGVSISTQVLRDPSLQAFKLNGFDFGLILPNYSKKQCKHVIDEISAQFKASFLELDVPSKLGFATFSYDKKTNLTKLLALADKQANN